MRLDFINKTLPHKKKKNSNRRIWTMHDIQTQSKINKS